jgi:hypothetical protein
MPIGPVAPLPLVLRRNRDAWGPILGFVYQVELSIVRLLDLGEDDVLELERGEDIDTIAGALTMGESPEAVVRVMEQVKERQTRLTLRSESARAALANFHDHRRANPSARLRFRLTTNAGVGRERPTPLPHPLAGIDAWESVRRGGLQEWERAELLAGIRTLLFRAQSPEGYDEHCWAEYQAWVARANEGELETFIAEFEWAVLAPEPASLRSQVVERLVGLGYAASTAEAEQQCDRLFVRMFHALARPGIKQFRLEDARRIIADIAADSDAQLLLRKLDALERTLESLMDRVGTLEDTLTPLQPWIERFRGLTDPAADTLTFQHTASFFGPRLNPANTFNHARPLLGRDDLRSNVVQDLLGALAAARREVVVIGGVGGVGKSRLLLEVARDLETRVAVRWARDEVEATLGSIAELPEGPVVIACDDAHRRRDLQVLFAICQQRPAATALLIGVRPWGRPAVRGAALRAGLSFEAVHDRGDLPDLDLASLTTLVKEELGAEDEGYAEALVRHTQGSAVVALVGARLLRTRAIAPALLAQDAEFGYAVLAGFRDETLGRLGDGLDSVLARHVLEYVAALGPVDLADNETVDGICAGLRADAVELRRSIGALVEAGVLRQDGDQVRIIPDVLADHILHGAIVAGGRATGFEGEVLRHAGSRQLPQLVRNLAELQWQLMESGQPANIFHDAWERLLAAFKSASNWERITLLGGLQRVAVFQPAEVLRLCEWVLENQEHLGNVEEPERYLGVPWPPERVVEKLPPLLGLVAEHREHYGRALDLLWTLARLDERRANQYPEHARRVLTDVVSYAPRDHVWRKELALEAFRRWTSEPGWSDHGESVLAVAKALLAMTILEDRWIEATNSIQLRRIPINPEFAGAVREGVIARLAELALGTEPRGRVLAAQELLAALNPPSSELGHEVTRKEQEEWRPQYEAALAALERVLAASSDPHVRMTVKDELIRTIRRSRLPWLRARARRVRMSIDETAAMMHARVVAWKFGHDPWLEHRGTRARRAKGLARGVITQVGGPDAGGFVEFLRFQCASLAAAGLDSREAPLLENLVEMRSDLAVGTAAWVLEPRPGDRVYAEWLPSLLTGLSQHQPEAYSLLLEAAAGDPRAEVRHTAAVTLHHAGRRGISAAEVALARALLRDSDRRVRTAMIDALFSFPATLAGELIGLVALEGDQSMASAVGQLWFRPAGDEPLLSDATAERLLRQLIEVPDVGDQHGGIERMVVAAATRWPVFVVDLLLQRVRREVASRSHYGEPGHVRYEAVPYPGWRGVWDGLRAAPGFPAALRRFRDAFREMHDELEDTAIDLVRDLVAWDAELEAVLREWIVNENPEEIRALGSFLEGLGPTMVLDHPTFVTDTLAAATALGHDVELHIRSALVRSASRQHRPVIARWVGEIDELDVRLEAEARRFAEGLPSGGSLHGVYATVAAEAAERLAADQRRRSSRSSGHQLPD